MSRSHAEGGFIFSAHFCKLTVPLRGTFAAFIHSCESPTDVGYATQDVSGEGSVYNIAGFCFANVGLDGQAKLSDFSATGWNYENDEIRILNAANCKSTKSLVWLTKDEAEGGGVGDKAGWYDASEFTYEGNLTFDLGSAFLTSLSSTGVKFQYAGQVYDQAFTIPCANKVYVLIPNALPRQISLSEVTATGWNYENDEIRKLNKSNCRSLKTFVWLTKDEAEGGGVGNKAGWYDASEFTYEGAQTLNPGDGLMTSLSSTGISINMPAVTGAE